MPKYTFFKEEFDKLATNGAIGHPDGKPGYSYIRVSSDEQGDEGRSGLPRQLEHVHEIAYKNRIRIPWDMLFADDFTGFEFEGRPELSRLRAEYRSSQQRKATVVVMEYLDRLSRNADWHQGFLLEEMSKRGIDPLFWKSFSSRVERMVMGVVSQDAMLLTLERMADGTRKKAEDGRVPNRRPNYGYKFVDEYGNEGERAKKMTYYAIREDQAAIMRLVYQRVAAGDTLVSIAKDLDAAHVPPPKNAKQWIGASLNKLVRREVYKGELIAHRKMWAEVERPNKDGLTTRLVKVVVQRPPEEWIVVPVPAIVDAALWQAANDMLARNKAMASRRAKQRYLLTGMMRCAECGKMFHGRTLYPTEKNHYTSAQQSYGCPYHGGMPKYRIELHGKCSQPRINASIIEPVIWKVVCDSLLEPEYVINTLREDLFNDHNTQLDAQIASLDAQIAAKQSDDQKVVAAYMAGAFDANEFAERRNALKVEAAGLAAERDRLIPQRATVQQFEAQKAFILEASAGLHSSNLLADPPFEVKQRVLKMMVKQIVINTRDKWFRLEGIVRGEFALEKTTTNRKDTALSK